MRAVRLLVQLCALSALAGCSLIIDSSEYVATGDAAVRDGGMADTNVPDMSPSDGGDDQGGAVTCGTSVCSGSTPYCIATNFCGECTQNSHCANNVCDTLTGSCVDPIGDCGACPGNGVCVPFPAMPGSFACILCDRDEDGFTSSWNLCNDAAQAGRPRDCNDGDPQQYPGISPICADGFLQGCPAPEYDGLIQHLGGGVVELGRTQVYRVANGINLNAQLSALAMPPSLAIPNEDPNAARWAFGYLDNGSAILATVQERGFNQTTGQFEWNESGAPLFGSPGWPFDENEVTAFTLASVAHPSAPDTELFRFGAAGKIGGNATNALLAQNATTPSMINVVAMAAETAGFQPPLAVMGTATSSELVFRIGGAVGTSLLSSLVGGQTILTPLAPDTPQYVLETEGEYVFYRTNSGSVGFWNGTANGGRQVDMTTIGGNAVGPARFARDGVGPIVGLVPYATGVRVVSFDCPGNVFDNCETTSTAIQSVLPNMTLFDFEVRGNVLFVAFAQGDSVMLHVLTLNAGVLTQRTTQPLRLIAGSDNSPPLQSVIAVETDVHFGPNHVEIVVGAVANTNGGTAAILATGIRGCSAL